MSKRDPEFEDEVQTESEQQVERPPLYRVLLHNDDFTTMDFVVLVLTSVFHKSEFEAIRIMLKVHFEGIGVAGLYPYEVAEMKVATVTHMAQEREFPLLCTMEPE